jgi:hypothetical protein
MGTSSSWVNVPDLRNKKLTLSSLFLGKESQEEQTQVIATGNKRPARPALVVGPASFSRGDAVFYRFVLYNAATDIQQTSNLMLKVEVLNSGASVYDGAWQPLFPRVIRSDMMGTEIGGQIKMGTVPGVYTLRVTIKDDRSHQIAQQTADLELEP